MIHRAVLGSLERFIAILLEHTAGKLPALARAGAGARAAGEREGWQTTAPRVAAALRAAGLRAEADVRNEKLGYKIREAQLEKMPVHAVVGEREAADGTVAPRTRAASNCPSTSARRVRRGSSTEARHA